MNEGDSRRAVENIDIARTEKVESNALVLSSPPGEQDTVLDPLREQGNEQARNEAEVMNCVRDLRRLKRFIWGSRVHFAPNQNAMALFFGGTYTVVSETINFKFNLF